MFKNTLPWMILVSVAITRSGTHVQQSDTSRPDRTWQLILT